MATRFKAHICHTYPATFGTDLLHLTKVSCYLSDRFGPHFWLIRYLDWVHREHPMPSPLNLGCLLYVKPRCAGGTGPRELKKSISQGYQNVSAALRMGRHRMFIYATGLEKRNTRPRLARCSSSNIHALTAHTGIISHGFRGYFAIGYSYM